MSAWITALIAVAAVTVTYFCCVRPMVRGRGHRGMARGSGPQSGVDWRIAELRGELRVLRAQGSRAGGQVPGGAARPGVWLRDFLRGGARADARCHRR
ncbi:MAG: hypothetical protein ACRDQ4_20445 [Pseudonocardiaceae bacterium]